LRFASPKPTLSDRELDALTQLDRHSSEALLAIDLLTGEVVRVARFAAIPVEPGGVDVAVTVGDRWQGNGLGTALLARLIDPAEDERHLAARMSGRGTETDLVTGAFSSSGSRIAELLI
jgi:hypothetical protein